MHAERLSGPRGTWGIIYRPIWCRREPRDNRKCPSRWGHQSPDYLVAVSNIAESLGTWRLIGRSLWSSLSDGFRLREWPLRETTRRRRCHFRLSPKKMFRVWEAKATKMARSSRTVGGSPWLEEIPAVYHFGWISSLEGWAAWLEGPQNEKGKESGGWHRSGRSEPIKPNQAMLIPVRLISARQLGPPNWEKGELPPKSHGYLFCTYYARMISNFFYFFPNILSGTVSCSRVWPQLELNGLRNLDATHQIKSCDPETSLLSSVQARWPNFNLVSMEL